MHTPVDNFDFHPVKIAFYLEYWLLAFSTREWQLMADFKFWQIDLSYANGCWNGRSLYHLWKSQGSKELGWIYSVRQLVKCWKQISIIIAHLFTNIRTAYLVHCCVLPLRKNKFLSEDIIAAWDSASDDPRSLMSENKI